MTLNSGGAFTYIPEKDFNGSDSFSYTANDGTSDSNVANVSITVNAVNDSPVANDDSTSTTRDKAVTIGVLANDSDVDGDALGVTNLTQPTNGAVTLNADQTVTYTPSTGFVGDDSFTYTANDGTVNSNTATVSISVTAPTAVNEYVRVLHRPVVPEPGQRRGDEGSPSGGRYQRGCQQ